MLSDDILSFGIGGSLESIKVNRSYRFLFISCRMLVPTQMWERIGCIGG